jgi:membrane-bound serine protease (ClpP class)
MTKRPLVLALLAVVPLTVGALAVGLAVVAFRFADPDQGTAAAGAVYRVPVHGVIELGLAPFIERNLREAKDAGASAVILDIDTPGGRIDAAQQIVDAIEDSPVPVYAFVNRRAFSAGALISLAAKGIEMRPGAVIGAATPVTGEGKKASEKIVSAMRSEMRALAESHDLDPRVAEAMVDEDIAIDGVVESGKLLTLTTDEAVRLGYARQVEDWDALVSSLGLADRPVVVARTNWAETLVRFLTNPAVAPILLSIGVLSIIIEIKTAAFGLAGLVGITSLGLFFGAHYLVGLAGLEEFLFLGAGLVLLALEAFVIPGFGIAGILGVAALATSVYLSLVSNMATAADLGTAAGIVSLTGIVIVVAGWALIRTLPRSGRFGRSGLMLDQSASRETGYLSAAARPELLGATGVAVTDLRPAGVARFGEEKIDVVAESEFIAAGTPVKIISEEGYRHVVRPV